MSLEPNEWHHRYLQQARWTKELRRYLFERAGIGSAKSILEVGVGSGAVLSEFEGEQDLDAFGMDIDTRILQLAARHIPHTRLIQGDAHFLPLASNSVDVSYCHYFLLWVSDPSQIVGELKRVTKSGGAVMALAEPDYGGRIDYPMHFSQLGRWQTEALKQQGADPYIGRRLAELFTNQGLVNIETGVMGGEWKSPPSTNDWNVEWGVLESDLSGLVPKITIKDYKDKDFNAWKRGERILYVPTFYSWGRSP